MTLDTWLTEMEAQAQAATPAEQLALNRYDHGGGRLASPADWMSNNPSASRDLVADFYNEADREFYFVSRTNVPRLIRLVRALRKVIEAQIAYNLAEAQASRQQGIDEGWKARAAERDALTALHEAESALAAVEKEVGG